MPPPQLYSVLRPNGLTFCVCYVVFWMYMMYNAAGAQPQRGLFAVTLEHLYALLVCTSC